LSPISASATTTNDVRIGWPRDTLRLNRPEREKRVVGRAVGAGSLDTASSAAPFHVAKAGRDRRRIP
jgi:hypothetical protein